VNSSETKCNGKTESNRKLIEPTYKHGSSSVAKVDQSTCIVYHPTTNNDCNGYVNCLQINDDCICEIAKKNVASVIQKHLREQKKKRNIVKT
jgi:hypothetical protein